VAKEAGQEVAVDFEKVQADAVAVAPDVPVCLQPVA